jgi:phosphinothricin acetyltransferase
MGGEIDNLVLEAMSGVDWPAVKATTFETTTPDWASWDKEHLASCRLVARSGERVVGWAALTPVSGRCVYAGVAEVSVYVAADSRGKGVGNSLYHF